MGHPASPQFRQCGEDGPLVQRNENCIFCMSQSPSNGLSFRPVCCKELTIGPFV